MAVTRDQTNIAGVTDPGELLAQKGSLIGAEAANTPVEIPPGPDGEALVYDSAAVGGITSRPFDSASVNVQNAANASLFRMGM